jgi:hypothetical protein
MVNKPCLKTVAIYLVFAKFMNLGWHKQSEALETTIIISFIFRYGFILSTGIKCVFDSDKIAV